MKKRLFCINLLLAGALFFLPFSDVTLCDESVAMQPERILRIYQPYYMMDEDDEAFRIEHPEVEIERVNKTGVDPDDADIMYITTYNELLFLAKQGKIVPLTLNAELEAIVQTYEPVFQQALLYNNSFYGIPTNISINCYVADNALWDACGKPALPVDLNTFFEQVERFALPSIPIGYYDSLEEILCSLSNQYSVQYWPESGPVNFDTPVYRDLLTRMKKLASQGIKGSRLYFYPDCAGYPYGLLDLFGDDDDPGIPFLYPTFEMNQSPKLSVTLDSYVINANSPNQDIAMLYLSFIAKNTPDWLQLSLSPQSVIGTDIEIDPMHENALTEGLAYYRQQAPHISVNGLFILSAYIDDFYNFLSGVLTEDELVETLNHASLYYLETLRLYGVSYE